MAELQIVITILPLPTSDYVTEDGETAYVDESGQPYVSEKS